MADYQSCLLQALDRARRERESLHHTPLSGQQTPELRHGAEPLAAYKAHGEPPLGVLHQGMPGAQAAIALKSSLNSQLLSAPPKSPPTAISPDVLNPQTGDILFDVSSGEGVPGSSVRRHSSSSSGESPHSAYFQPMARGSGGSGQGPTSSSGGSSPDESGYEALDNPLAYPRGGSSSYQPSGPHASGGGGGGRLSGSVLSEEEERELIDQFMASNVVEADPTFGASSLDSTHHHPYGMGIGGGGGGVMPGGSSGPLSSSSAALLHSSSQLQQAELHHHQHMYGGSFEEREGIPMGYSNRASSAGLSQQHQGGRHNYPHHQGQHHIGSASGGSLLSEGVGFAASFSSSLSPGSQFKYPPGSGARLPSSLSSVSSEEMEPQPRYPASSASSMRVPMSMPGVTGSQTPGGIAVPGPYGSAPPHAHASRRVSMGGLSSRPSHAEFGGDMPSAGAFAGAGNVVASRSLSDAYRFSPQHKFASSRGGPPAAASPPFQFSNPRNPGGLVSELSPGSLSATQQQGIPPMEKWCKYRVEGSWCTQKRCRFYPCNTENRSHWPNRCWRCRRSNCPGGC